MVGAISARVCRDVSIQRIYCNSDSKLLYYVKVNLAFILSNQ